MYLSSVRLLAVLGLASCSAIVACDGCTKKPPGDGESVGPGESVAEDDAAGSSELAGTLDASHRASRDAEPRAFTPDGGVELACTGDAIAMTSVFARPPCAIRLVQAKQLRAALELDGGRPPLRQEARAADDHVDLRVVNTGRVPLTLPLSFHPKLPAFTVLAEDEQHTIYELEAPQFEPPSEGDGGADHARFARLVLPAGAAATARIVIDTRIVARLGVKCADGGTCAPPRLPQGKYTLHVGELLMDVEAGAPARVAWVVH